MADPGPFLWNDKAGRYVGPGGRFVSSRAVQQAHYAATNKAALRMQDASQKLRDGNVSLRDWQLVMRREVKNVQLYSAAAVKGGWAQMGPADYGRVGQRIREQYKYLDRFAGEIARGETPLDGRLLTRSGLYGHSGRQTSHLFERVEKKARDFSEERSLVTAGESCIGCTTEAARGWVRIGDLVPIGDRICNMNCACNVEYR